MWNMSRPQWFGRSSIWRGKIERLEKWALDLSVLSVPKCLLGVPKFLHPYVLYRVHDGIAGGRRMRDHCFPPSFSQAFSKFTSPPPSLYISAPSSSSSFPAFLYNRNILLLVHVSEGQGDLARSGGRGGAILLQVSPYLVCPTSGRGKRITRSQNTVAKNTSLPLLWRIPPPPPHCCGGRRGRRRG